MEHLVIGLMIMNLSARIIARIAQVEVVAGSAFVAGPNDVRLASVAVSRVNSA